jgi:hypothetical protein
MISNQQKLNLLASLGAVIPTIASATTVPQNSNPVNPSLAATERLEVLSRRVEAISEERKAGISDIQSVADRVVDGNSNVNAELVGLRNELDEVVLSEATISRDILTLAEQSSAVANGQLENHDFMVDQSFRMQLLECRINFGASIGTYISPELVDHLFVVNLAVTMVESLNTTGLDKESSAAFEKQRSELLAYFRSGKFSQKESQDFLRSAFRQSEIQLPRLESIDNSNIDGPTIGPSSGKIEHLLVPPGIKEFTPLQESFAIFEKNVSDVIVEAAKLIGETGKWSIDQWNEYRMEKIITEYLEHSRVPALAGIVGPLGAIIGFSLDSQDTACSGLFEKLDTKLNECVTETTTRFQRFRDSNDAHSDEDHRKFFSERVLNNSDDYSRSGNDVFIYWDWGSSSIFDEYPTWNHGWDNDSENEGVNRDLPPSETGLKVPIIP